MCAGKHMYTCEYCAFVLTGYWTGDVIAHQIADDEEHPLEPHRSGWNSAWNTESRLIGAPNREKAREPRGSSRLPPWYEGFGRAYLSPRLFLLSTLTFVKALKWPWRPWSTVTVAAEGNSLPRQPFVLCICAVTSTVNSRHFHATHVKVQLPSGQSSATSARRCSSGSPTTPREYAHDVNRRVALVLSSSSCGIIPAAFGTWNSGFSKCVFAAFREKEI